MILEKKTINLLMKLILYNILGKLSNLDYLSDRNLDSLDDYYKTLHNLAYKTDR